MPNLLLLGAGQIGSRHLQGIAKESLNYNITVVDCSILSLKTAQKRWNEAGGGLANHKISWLSELPKDTDLFDLAIVATSSKNRASLIDQVTRTVSVNSWILEKVVEQSTQNLNKIQYITRNAKAVFVNMVRRTMNWYQQLSCKFLHTGPFRVTMSGKYWGLACNSLHYIDLISWWSGETVLSIHAEKLNKNWFESKRKGYFEVNGSLLVKFSKGTELVLQSYSDPTTADVMKIELHNKDIWTIKENEGIAFSSNGDSLNGKCELQSEMTGRIVTNFLRKKTCELPIFKETLNYHAIFTDTMLSHWNYSSNQKDKEVPIT